MLCLFFTCYDSVPAIIGNRWFFVGMVFGRYLYVADKTLTNEGLSDIRDFESDKKTWPHTPNSIRKSTVCRHV